MKNLFERMRYKYGSGHQIFAAVRATPMEHNPCDNDMQITNDIANQFRAVYAHCRMEPPCNEAVNSRIWDCESKCTGACATQRQTKNKRKMIFENARRTEQAL